MKEKIASLCVLLLLLATLLPAQIWRGDEAVAVQVNDSKGRSVADARVVFTFQGTSGQAGPDVVATNDRGRAVLVDLAPGPWQVEVSHPDYLSYIAMVDVRRGKKPLVNASFLEAGGRSLSPVKVKFSKGDRQQASPVLEARQTVEPPAAIAPAVEESREPAPQMAEAPTPVPPAPAEPEQAPEAKPEPVVEAAPPAEPTPVPKPVKATPPPPAPEPEPEPAVADPEVVEPAVPEIPAVEPEIEEPPAQAIELPAPEPVIDEVAPTAAAAPPVPDSVPEPVKAMPQPAEPEPEPVPEPVKAMPQPAEPEPEPVPEPEQVPEAMEAVPEEIVAPEPETPLPSPQQQPSAPPKVATPAPLPAAAALPPPPDPGALVTSHSDGSCGDCESAEWTLQVSVAAPAMDPGSTGRCGGEVLEAARAAMQGLSTSIQLEIDGFIGPVSGGSSQEAIRRVEPDLAAPFEDELAAFTGGRSPCQVVGLVLPKAVRFSRVRLAAGDREEVGGCAPGQTCSIGDAAWLGSVLVERGPSATLVYGLFENRSADRGRRAILTAYYRPPNANWKPRLPAAD
jgi:hypothetical protein